MLSYNLICDCLAVRAGLHAIGIRAGMLEALKLVHRFDLLNEAFLVAAGVRVRVGTDAARCAVPHNADLCTFVLRSRRGLRLTKLSGAMRLRRRWCYASCR